MNYFFNKKLVNAMYGSHLDSLSNKLKNIFEDFIYLFLGRGGGRKRERNIHVRKKHQSVASCMCPN